MKSSLTQTEMFMYEVMSVTVHLVTFATFLPCSLTNLVSFWKLATDKHIKGTLTLNKITKFSCFEHCLTFFDNVNTHIAIIGISM